MPDKRLEDMLWKSIVRIKSENDVEFARYILQARSDFLRLRVRQEPAIRKVYIDAADNVADQLKHLRPTIGQLTRNHLTALEKSLRVEAERITQAVTGRLQSDLTEAVKLGGRPMNDYFVKTIRDSGSGLDVVKLQRGFGDVSTRAVEAIWSRTRHEMRLSDRIWQAGDKARTAIQNIIWDGVARGRDAVQVAKDLEKYVRYGAKTLAKDYPNMMKRFQAGSPEWVRKAGFQRIPDNLSYEALRLARTEMSIAAMEGTYAAGRVNPSYKGSRWNLSAGHPLQDVCDGLATADLYDLGPGGYPQGEEPITPHPNCVVGGTIVSGPRVLAGTTRWYEGEIVELKTGNGHLLTVTPNHPVLTPEGWVAAGLLKEGSYVVSCSRGEWDGAEFFLTVVDPDDYQVPAVVEDVARSVGETGGVVPITMPVTSKDFHGDGIGSEICVVRSDGFLRNRGDASFVQPSLKEFLVFGDSAHSLFSSQSSTASVYEGLGFVSDSVVSGFGIPSILFRSALGMYQRFGLPQGSTLDAGYTEPDSDSASGYTVFMGQELLRLASKILLDEPFDGQWEFSSPGIRPFFDHKLFPGGLASEKSLFDEGLLEPRYADVVRGSSIFDAVAGQIGLDRIIKINRGCFRGHVYNLQTTQGWYSANSIITHNCLCYVTPLLVSAKEIVQRLKRWRDDPSLEPDLEEWYNEVYRGQGDVIVVPSVPRSTVSVQVPTQGLVPVQGTPVQVSLVPVQVVSQPQTPILAQPVSRPPVMQSPVGPGSTGAGPSSAGTGSGGAGSGSSGAGSQKRPSAVRRTPTPKPILTKANWAYGIRRLSGKQGTQLQSLVDDLKDRFRKAYNTELEFDARFLRVLSSKGKGGVFLRKTVIEAYDALDAVPIEAIGTNPHLKTMLLGPGIPAWGAYDDVSGTVIVSDFAFLGPPEWIPGAKSHAVETLIYEIGHAVHFGNDAHFWPWVTDMWRLDPRRQNNFWDINHYKTLTGTIKDTFGITRNGLSDPTEDFADSWRLAYVGRNHQTQSYLYDQAGVPHYRFRLLRDLIARLGWRVPVI